MFVFYLNFPIRNCPLDGTVSRANRWGIHVKFQHPMTNTTRAIETLAAEIGDRIYMDIAKWHLYLENAKLHQTLAEQLYPLLEGNSVESNRVLEVLQSIPISLGGGKRDIPLVDLLPSRCQTELMEILEDFQRQM